MDGLNETHVRHINVQALHPAEDFRLDEDTNALAELAVSIADLGVLQPLTVRKVGKQLEVIAGRRRLAAARIVGLFSVPCTVVEADDDRATAIAIAENLHRRNLSPVEEGLALARLRDQGMKQGEIASLVGRSQAHVSKMLQVLALPADLRDMVHRREIGYITALDRARRGGGPKTGGRSTRGGPGTGDEAAVASHWRRRHDRIIAGVRAVMHHRPDDPARWMELLDRLLKLDLEPLDGPTDERAA